MIVNQSKAMKSILAHTLKRDDKCWIWTARKDRTGYGKCNFVLANGRRETMAHRLAYLVFVGEIPKHLELDHLCRNRSCVNPYHLEPVTRRENQLRGLAPHIVLHRMGVCAKGHALTAQPNGRNSCRICNLEATRRYKLRKQIAA